MRGVDLQRASKQSAQGKANLTTIWRRDGKPNTERGGGIPDDMISESTCSTQVGKFPKKKGGKEVRWIPRRPGSSDRGT